MGKKTVVVTGGSRGIGRMLVDAFLARGDDVFVTSRSPEDVPGARVFPCDLGTEDGCLQVAAWLRTEGVRTVDVLVNNSGASWGAPYETYPEKAWKKLLALNVEAVFFLTRALDDMLVRGSAVINIGSVMGLQPCMGANNTFAYEVSKAAVHHLTKLQAAQLAERGVTANAIAAGLFPTKMTKGVLDVAADAMLDTVPLGRFGQADDVARVGLMFADSPWITGTVLPVDGGMLLKMPSRL